MAPTDPFAQPPQVAPPTTDGAAPPPPAKRTPWNLIIGAVVVVVAVVVGIVVFTGGDSDDAGGDATTGGTDNAGEWHLMRVDDTGVSVLDLAGAVVRTIELPEGFVPTLTQQLGRWLPGEPDGTSLTVIDLSDGTAHTLELPAEGMMLDRGLLASGGDMAVYFSASGGPLALADFAAGTARPLGEHDKYVPFGRRPGFALYFSLDEPATVIVPIDDPAAAWEVPGGVADVHGTDALVLQTEDFVSTAFRFSGTEQQGEGITFKAAIDGGILTDTGAVVIDTGGGVDSVDFAAGTYSLLGTLGIGIDVAVPLGTDHLMAWGASGTALVNIDGTVVQLIDPVADADGNPVPLQPAPGGVGSECVSVQPGPAMVPQGITASVWNIATLEKVAELQSTPLSAAADGCTVVTVGNPAEVVIDGVLVDVGLLSVQVISPDHLHVIGRAESPDGATGMAMVTVADGTQVPLEVGGYFYARF